MFLPRSKAKNGLFRLAERKIRTSTKYNIDSDFLSRGLVSHHHAWFWGLFLTDGTITRNQNLIKGLKWRQKYDSYPMLEALRGIISSNHPIVFDGTPDGKYQCCILELNSTKLATDAQKLMGCNASRKTFDLVFPQIEPVFLSSLIRGIIDGDGSWGFRLSKYPRAKLSISSANEAFLRRIRSEINRNCLKTRDVSGHIYANGNVFELCYHKKAECLEIGRWMYQNDYPCIPKCHKYNRFVFCEKMISSNWTMQERRDNMILFKKQEVEKCVAALKCIIALQDDENNSDGFRFRKNFYKVPMPK